MQQQHQQHQKDSRARSQQSIARFLTAKRQVVSNGDVIGIDELDEFVNHFGHTSTPKRAKTDEASCPAQIPDRTHSCPVPGCGGRFTSAGALAGHLKWRHEG